MPNGRKPLQDEAVQRVKQTSKLFLALLEKWKGKKKDASVRDNANGYYAELNKTLPLLFSQRWERSPAEGSWNDFVAAWNNGNCKWKTAYEALKILNDGLQQSG